MELAISNIAWKDFENENIYDYLQEQSIPAIEVAPAILTKSSQPFDLTDQELIALKSRLATEFNLKTVSMQSVLFGTDGLQLFGDEESRSKLSQHMEKVVHFCSLLGIKNIVFGSPKNRIKGDLSFDQALEQSSPFFYKIAESGKEHGVVLSMEANAKDYGADFVTTNEEAIQLIEQVNHSHFKLNYDVSTVRLNNEDFQSFIPANIHHINHVHFSAPFLDVFPGEGGDIYKHIHKVLLDCDYSRYISIEMKSQSPTDNRPSVEAAIQFLKSL